MSNGYTEPVEAQEIYVYDVPQEDKKKLLIKKITWRNYVVALILGMVVGEVAACFNVV